MRVKDDEVGELVEAMQLVAVDSTPKELAKALHRIAISSQEVSEAFNAEVERRLTETLSAAGLKRVPLTKLMTKNRFGAN